MEAHVKLLGLVSHHDPTAYLHKHRSDGAFLQLLELALSPDYMFAPVGAPRELVGEKTVPTKDTIGKLIGVIHKLEGGVDVDIEAFLQQFDGPTACAYSHVLARTVAVSYKDILPYLPERVWNNYEYTKDVGFLGYPFVFTQRHAHVNTYLSVTKNNGNLCVVTTQGERRVLPAHLYQYIVQGLPEGHRLVGYVHENVFYIAEYYAPNTQDIYTTRMLTVDALFIKAPEVQIPPITTVNTEQEFLEVFSMIGANCTADIRKDTAPRFGDTNIINLAYLQKVS